MNDYEKEKILDEYEKKGDELVYKMLQILTRAHRKVDDVKYRKILARLK